jgi:hypothetical protein
MNILRRLLIGLSLSTDPAVAQNVDTFTSKTAGVTVKKPTGWTFDFDGRTTPDVSAEDLQAIDGKPGRLTLVQLSKEGAFNNFGISLVARTPHAAGASPQQVVEYLVLPALQKERPELKVEALRPVEVSGHAAAEYVATDMIRSPAGNMPIRLRAIIVPRGKFFFLIDMMAPIAGYDESTKEFVRNLERIVITK